MGNFCKHCGNPIDAKTGLCTNCSQSSAPEPAAPVAPAPTKEEKREAWTKAKKQYKEDLSAKRSASKKAKKEKFDAMPKNQKTTRILIKIGILVLLAGLLIGGIFYVLHSFGLFDKKPDNNNSSLPTASTPQEDSSEPQTEYPSLPDTDPDDYKVPEVDADEYYNQNADVVEQIPADSVGKTEAEAYQNLTSRGFTTQPITTSYLSDGSYIEETEISSSGTATHPMYTTYFFSDAGYVWMIYEINGEVFASPVSFNGGGYYDTEVMLSEKETVVGYDSASNKFYVIKPNDTLLDIKVVSQINAETLNSLSPGEVAGL